jgi:hypothetical protein
MFAVGGGSIGRKTNGYVTRVELIRIKHLTREVLVAIVSAAEPRVHGLLRDDALRAH